MFRRGLLGALILAVLFALPAVAQEQTGSIEGVVKDSSGGVLPGVTIEARSPQVVGVSTAVTDEKGAYRFPALPPGRYELNAVLSGFSAPKMPAMLALGQLLKVEIVMSVATLSESVQVTAESPLIDTKQNAQFATVQTEAIERIPKGRDFTSVVATAPGAQNESYSGGIQVDGASGSENRFVVDGMDATNLKSGVSGKTVLVDFIQEVQVKSAGYNAEFGGATGGVVSAITKSGSNAFHGGGAFYFTSDSLRADNRDLQRINQFDDETVETQRTPVDGRKYSNPVLDLGGPLAKDKMWFYAGYAWTQDKNDRTVKFLYSPTYEQKSYTDDTKTHYLNWNLNTQLNKDIRLKVSGANTFQQQRGALPSILRNGTTLYGFPGLDGQPGNGYSDASWSEVPAVMEGLYEKVGTNYVNNLYSANLDWVLTPTLFANITAGSLRYNNTTPSGFAGTETRHVFSRSAIGYAPVPVELQHGANWQDTKSSADTRALLYGRFFINANTIWYKNLAGQHTFKAGMRYERLDQDSDDGERYPRVMLSWNASTTDVAGRSVRGTYGYFRVRQIMTVGKVHSNNYGFWLQDAWSVNSKLTVNAGVRAENEHVPTYTQTSDAQGIDFGFGDKIAPRVGFAYDIKGNSQWKLYGSYGHFYDITKLSLPMGAFGADKWIDYYFTLDTYNWPSITCTDGLTGTGCTGGKLIKSRDMRYNSSQNDPRLIPYYGAPRSAIDPTLKPFQTREFTLGMDHELNPTMSVGVRYVHKWLVKGIEDVGRLLPFGELYFISNPGYGDSYTILPDFPDKHTPPAERKYDSIEVRLKRRLANRWSAEFSYTFSKLQGNYSGLGASDEEGRTDPNVSRAFDSLYQSYNQYGEWVGGYLKTDRPHVAKLQATYDLPWGTSLGLFGIVQSGIPWSSYMDWNGYSPVFFDNRGNMGRTPTYSRFDLAISHDFRLGKYRLNLNANVDNLFDQKTVTDYWENVWRDPIEAFGDETFFAGFNAYDLAAKQKAMGYTLRDNPLFGEAYSKMGARSVRVGAKFTF
jgi:hypothetical protein